MGAHSRFAVGMADLPFGVPVEIGAEVEIEADKENDLCQTQ